MESNFGLAGSRRTSDVKKSKRPKSYKRATRTEQLEQELPLALFSTNQQPIYIRFFCKKNIRVSKMAF